MTKQVLRLMTDEELDRAIRADHEKSIRGDYKASHEFIGLLKENLRRKAIKKRAQVKKERAKARAHDLEIERWARDTARKAGDL